MLLCSIMTEYIRSWRKGANPKTQHSFEIGQLQALKDLNLRGCGSLTSLPSEIGQLQALIPLPLTCII